MQTGLTEGKTPGFTRKEGSREDSVRTGLGIRAGWKNGHSKKDEEKEEDDDEEEGKYASNGGSG